MWSRLLRPSSIKRGHLPIASARLYHSKTGVYGYNAPLHDQTKERLASVEGLDEEIEARRANPNLYRYVEAYRLHGHKSSHINPTKPPSGDLPILDPDRYGLGTDALSTRGILYGHAGDAKMTPDEITSYLKKVYCNTMALDLLCVENEAEAKWLCERYEELHSEELSEVERKALAKEMLKSQNFDHFLATKFASVKRYGGEGAEGMMGFFTEAILNAASHGFKEVYIGMAHRGRLNLLTGMLDFPPVAMFRKMKGLPEFPPDQSGAGDVLSHLTSSVDLPCLDGSSQVHVSMLPNPSHLEAVNPVTAGKVRGAHMTRGLGDYSPSGDGGLVGEDMLCLLVHGDAAVAGQGINQEIITMSNLPHYTVGGTVHFTIDNQVGFTTPSERGRSSRYSSDLARIVGAPVIHVNGDNPEEVVKATKLACQYKAKFMKDVFVEMHCVRKWGHNELDDPSFTNPQLYNVIDARGSVPDAYASDLTAKGLWSPDETNRVLLEHNNVLAKDFAAMETYQPKRTNLKAQWSNMREPEQRVTQWDTGLPDTLLRYIGSKSVSVPDSLNVHSHLKKMHVAGRLKKLEAGQGLDWGICEALAIGSLLYQGYNVRISGQDVGRATFAHRHVMLVDQETNEMHIPFNSMEGGAGGRIEVCNSLLSEEAVMAFEYGLSIDSPKNLAIWEAQFGDFFNGAQIILDTFVSSGESKWGLQSSLTILLPHGLDGAGPEHSSARLERFLQMTDSKEDGADGDDVNWFVVNPTTAAQYFHLLRRQMVRNFRKPLVVISPKVLLRLSEASSSLSEMAPGTHFQPVIGDSSVAPSAVRKVVFVCGKHYYSLVRHAKERGVTDTAFVRLEQLCPFPAQELQDVLKIYPNVKKFVWSQEEHRNAGAWTFVRPRFASMLGIKGLHYAGRSELCQPAVGVATVHRQEEAQVIEDTLSY